jgi:hypothetical protein
MGVRITDGRVWSNGRGYAEEGGCKRGEKKFFRQEHRREGRAVGCGERRFETMVFSELDKDTRARVCMVILVLGLKRSLWTRV